MSLAPQPANGLTMSFMASPLWRCHRIYVAEYLSTNHMAQTASDGRCEIPGKTLVAARLRFQSAELMEAQVIAEKHAGHSRKLENPTPPHRHLSYYSRCVSNTCYLGRRRALFHIYAASTSRVLRLSSSFQPILILRMQMSLDGIRYTAGSTLFPQWPQSLSPAAI